MQTHQSPFLFGSSLTLDWLEKTIKNRLEKTEREDLRISTWESRVGGDGKIEGKGYLSNPMKVQVEWEGEGAEEMPTEFFFKIPTTDNADELVEELKEELGGREDQNMSELDSPIFDLHNMECKAYDLWMEKEAPSDLIAVCFHTCPFNSRGEQPLILLQDLSKESVSPRFSQELGLEQALQLAELLAKMHAWSLDHEHLVKDFWLTDKILYFKPMHVNFLHEMSSKYPEYYEKAKVDRVVDAMSDEVYVRLNHISRRQTSISPVLVHGDIWYNNIRLRKTGNANHSMKRILAVVDWQLVHFGSPAEDFARLLFGNGGPELRRRGLLNEVLPHYFSILRSSLGREPPFDEKEFLSDWEEMYQPGWIVFLAFTTLGVMTKAVEPEGLEGLLLRGKALLEDVLKVWDGQSIL